MTLIIPTGYVQCALVFRHVNDPDPWAITVGASNLAFDGTKEQLLNDVGVTFAETVLPFMDSQVQLVEVTGRFQESGDDPLLLSVPFGASGSGSGPKLPQNCALHVKKITALGGKKGKGRFFVPGILSADTVGETGVIGNSPLTDLQVAFTNWHTNMTEVGNEGRDPILMVLLHNSLISGVETATPITSLQVDSMISTQRRRLR